jgi:hypothetical protein
MNISTAFFTLALIVASFITPSCIHAMDIGSYKNQALTSIRLELWYQGIDKIAESTEMSPEVAKETRELPEELAVALQMQLAH